MKKRIKSIAERMPEQEACGLVLYGNGKIRIEPTLNMAKDKRNLFQIRPRDIIDANGLVGIFHSHIESDSRFSEKDILFSEEWGLPFFVFSLLDKKHGVYIPKNVPKTRKFKNFLKKIKKEYSV